MNTGQMMLTIAAMFLLSMTILTTNRGFLSTSSTMIESRYDILGVSVAASIIENATSLAFDENTVGTSVTSTNSLTLLNQLGIDGNEHSTNHKEFDDFDDYDCYRNTPKLDTVQIEGSTLQMFFNSYCRVDYIDGSDPNTISNTRTYHKRLSVSVYAPGMNDTVKMSTVYSYWYFR